MTVTAPATSTGMTEHELRGSPRRLNDFKEQYQTATFNAMAAAAGCVVMAKPPIDEGIDLHITHRSTLHLRETTVLEVQLKATERFMEGDDDSLSVQLPKASYDYLRTPDPSIAKILVLMSLPSSRDRWIKQTDNLLVLRRANYWINLEGFPADSANKPYVHVPKAQRFDDVVLFEIMGRIGQGGKP